MADALLDAWDACGMPQSTPFDTPTSVVSSSSAPWDTSPSQPPAWDAQPNRAVNLASNPHAAEFPGTFTWTTHDELAATIIKCTSGSETYLRGSELGVGGYARVYKVIRQTDSRLFAGKTSTVTRKLIDEAKMLKRYTHGHLVKYEGWYAEEGRPEATMLLTELCAGGNLHEHINEICRAMKPGQILRVVKQVASALAYLHEQAVFHSDVKAKNIFIRSFSPMDVVLGDCADVKSVSCRGERLGTEGYYSPEMVARKRHCGCADDIWALGVTALGMMDQWPRVLYTREGVQRKYMRRIEKYPYQCWEHARDLERLNPANGVVKLLGRMLAWGVEERIRAEQLEGLAEGLLEGWDGKESLDLETPEGFEQISFW